MELKLMEPQELMKLYEEELVCDFPPAELKPLSAMLELMRRGCYHPLLFTDDSEILGYALVWLNESRTCALLDYLGILRGKRNGGLGARLLALLGERYSGIVAEAEAPVSTNQKENELRRHRLGFYQRNGFRLLNYDCALFGVHYRCLYCGENEKDEVIQSLHRQVYEEHFSAEHLERFIQLPLHPGETVHPAPAWMEEEESQ